MEERYGACTEQEQAAGLLVPLVQDDQDDGHIVARVSLADGVVGQALYEIR